MSIRIQNTSNITSEGVKILVYGAAGSGKTTLAATLPNPLVISAEAGLLSLKEHGLPFVSVGSNKELTEVYRWVVSSAEANQFDSIVLDSVSEIAEVILAEKLAPKGGKKPDGRQAYGEMQQLVVGMLRAWRDNVKKHVYFSAKMDVVPDESGARFFGPSMPGRRLSQELPYFFDEVFALRAVSTPEGIKRELLTQGDQQYIAKDRSGKLPPLISPPNLGDIIAHIEGA